MADEKADGSKKFKLVGGPHDKMKVRLYKFNDGWESLVLGGELYEAPTEQPAKGGSVLTWVGK